ncbi:MAG TPA: substrate-binding domain-containing protein, partial [Spirochaetia bacterium]
LSNPYHIAIVDAIVDALAAHDVFVSICSSSDKAEHERDAVRSLGQRRVDALIVIESPTFNTTPDATLDSFTIPGKPTILVNEHLSRATPHHVVRCAQEPGIRQALARFLDGGRRRIALFRGGPSYSFDLKETLFKGFVRDNGLDSRACPVVRVKRANDAQAVHDSARLVGELLHGRDAPQAVLACNDLIAIGAVQGALAAGARIPDDLAVIGVDNSIVSQFSSPPLSTVDLRMKTVGQTAARLFLELRERGFRGVEPARRTLDARLIVRGSG